MGAFELFPLFGYCEQNQISIRVWVFVKAETYCHFSKNRILGPYDKCMSNFMRNCHTFPSDHTMALLPTMYENSSCSNSCQYSVLSVLKNFSHSTEYVVYLSMVSICISLKTNDEHLCKCAYLPFACVCVCVCVCARAFTCVVSIQIFCPLFSWVASYYWVVRFFFFFFTYSGYKSFARYMFYKEFLPVGGSPFHFLNSIFWRTIV